MAIIDKLKDLYFAGEDSWYRLMDRLDSKIPVYKIIEPIDRVVPSFALFLAVVFLLIILAFSLLFGFLGAPVSSTFTVTVTDLQGRPVDNASVQLSFDGETKFLTTGKDGLTAEQIEVPLGKEVGIFVEKKGFASATDSVTTEEAVENVEVQLQSDAEAKKTVTFSVLDSSGQPVRQAVKLRFDCSNIDAEDPEEQTVYTGTAAVLVPQNCGQLKVDAEAEGFEGKAGEEIVSGGTIFMAEAFLNPATVIADLTFNGIPVTEAIEVELYKSFGFGDGSFVSGKIAVNGQATIQATAGTYFIRTKSSSSFSAKQSSDFTVSVGDTKNVALQLEQAIAGKIRLQANDSGTGNPIGGARFTLKLGTSEIESRTTTVDENGIVEFSVRQDLLYRAIAVREGYCSKSLNVRIGNVAVRFDLDRDTGQCGADLKAKVLTPDGKAVVNAKVSLYDQQGFSLGYEQQITDLNGEARFKNVDNGTYQIFAFKGTSFGWSDTKLFDRALAEETEYVVSMQVPDGTVRVRAIDADGIPVQFATVALVNSFGTETIEGPKPITDVNGTIDFITKADKDVYVVVSAQGFTTFTGPAVTVLPNSVQYVEAVLEPEIISGEITAQFLGLFKDGQRVTTVGAGGEYIARFQLKIPSNKQYDKIGFHARTGTTNAMEKDNIFIKKINVPGASAITRGTSYNPDEGASFDSKFLSVDGSKWITAEWSKFNTGLITIEATVKVKDTAEQNEELPLRWRAYAITKDKKTIRAPADASLGTAPSANDLYANTDEKIFQVSVETLCSSKWCFSASVYSLKTQLIANVTQSYSADIGNTYRLNFTITNNSESETDTFSGSEIRIMDSSETLQFGSYTVRGAEGQIISGTASKSLIDWTQIGTLSPTKDASVQLFFTPKKTFNAPILVQIRSGNRIVFEKEIRINVLAANELIAEFRQEGTFVSQAPVLASGIESELTIKVRDKKTQLEINGATISAKNRFGDSLSSAASNAQGVAILKLPAVVPGDKLTLAIEKPDYKLLEIILASDPSILLAEPAQIGATLNAKTEPSIERFLNLTNKTGMKLTIEDIKFTGDFRQLLDEEKMNDWLFAQYRGAPINAKQRINLTLQFAVSEVGEQIKKPENLEAMLEILTTANGQVWLTKVPIKIAIGLGGEVTDPTCFSVDKQIWETATEAAPVTIELAIKNSCVVSGKPVDLRNLQAQINYKSNALGTFTLRLGNAESEIRPGYFKVVRGIVEKDATIPATLTFTPDGGVRGSLEATIIFRAENATERGPQNLDDQLEAKITITSVRDCLRFNKDIVLLKPKDEKSFEIETKGCGAPVDVRFDIGSARGITLGQTEVTLQGTDRKEIQIVASEQQGQWPIYVSTRSASETQFSLTKLIRVRVEDPASCVSLNRYEFELYDDPNFAFDGYDTAKLYNKCAEKQQKVTIKYNNKDWGDAIKDSLKFAIIGGIIGAIVPAKGQQALGTFSLLCRFFKIACGEDKKTEEKPVEGGGAGEETPVEDTGSGTGGDTSDVGIEGGGFAPIEQPLAIPQSSGFASLSTTGHPTVAGAAGTLSALKDTAALAKDVAGLRGVIPSTFLGGFLTGAVFGTLINYFSQDKGEVSSNPVVDDVRIDPNAIVVLNAPRIAGGIPDPDFSVTVGQQSFEVNPLNPLFRTDIFELAFRNNTQQVQLDPLIPFYRILETGGERLTYNERYNGGRKLDELSRYLVNPTVKERNPYNSDFHLQFNSFRPQERPPPPPVVKACQIGDRTGETGAEAVPDILLDWSWSSIQNNTCDTEGGGTFCDATQFSIALLKRIQTIRTALEGQSLSCPSVEGILTTREQGLAEFEKDVAVTKVSIEKDAANAKVKAVVQSNNAVPMKVNVTFVIENQTTKVRTLCTEAVDGTKTIDVTSSGETNCTFKNLTQGTYDVNVVIAPQLSTCPQGTECKNGSVENDKINTQFLVGSAAGIFEQCEPYNTKRLNEFAQANPGNSAVLTALDNIVFNVNLMQDGYTSDFQKDFDDYSKTKSFFGAPSYYLDTSTGLQKFFKEPAKFRFASPFLISPNAPLPAGKYKVTINIEYNNKTWNLFKGDETDAVMNIELERLAAPEPDSVFYYMPFDGLLGVDTDNGRQGYGVNYRQESLAFVPINDDPSQRVITETIPGSNPVPGGWVLSSMVSDFRRMNIDQRGIVLDVRRDSAAQQFELRLAPSKATPVILRVDGGQSDKAYAFYSAMINNQPQNIGSALTLWDGVTFGCRDFHDREISEQFRQTKDIHGGVGASQCAGTFSITDYGLEWCAVKRSGPVFLSTVFFTPQGSTGILQMTDAQDNATFFTQSAQGRQVSLDTAAASISSVKNVLDLVAQDQVCIVGRGNSVQQQFFWNPQELVQVNLQTILNTIPGQCIGPAETRSP